MKGSSSEVIDNNFIQSTYPFQCCPGKAVVLFEDFMSYKPRLILSGQDKITAILQMAFSFIFFLFWFRVH